MRSEPPAPAPFSIRRRIRLTYALLGCLLLIATAEIGRQVYLVQRDLYRLADEAREGESALRLLRKLEAVDTTLSGDSLEVREAGRKQLSDAQRVLAEIESGQAAEHAADTAHQEQESSLLGTISTQLLAVEAAWTRGGVDAARQHLSQAREVTEQLCQETAAETLESESDIGKRSIQMLWVLCALTVAILGILGLSLFALRRSVLGPLEGLAAGASRFGPEDLEHRLDPAPAVELAQVTAAFNKMADRLQTSHEQLEERVEERSRELLRASRLADLGVLAAGVAHEINNPLASVASCAEALLRRGDDTSPEAVARRREYLVVINQEAYRARDITQGLLTFARENPGPRGPVDLRQICEEVLQLERPAAEQGGQHISLQAAAPAYVQGNASELTRVLQNLVRNARHAAGPAGRVEIRCESAASEARVDVGDSGPGVPRADQERIFDPFVSSKARGEGTGLGLAIAQRIVLEHHGRLSVGESPLGGACFTVQLPSLEVAP